MKEAPSSLEDLVKVAQGLSLVDRVRLIERLASTLEHELSALPDLSSDPLYGLLADYGPAPSAEEIDEMRREAWAGFPHEDIG